MCVQMFREGPGNWIYVQLLEAKARLKEDRGLAKVGNNTTRHTQRHTETHRDTTLRSRGLKECDGH